MTTTHNRALRNSILLILLLAIIPAASALVATSQMGYHPEANKQVVVYTNDAGGTFSVHDAATNATVLEGTLEAPLNYDGEEVACQGNNPCLTGDFSSLTDQGTYVVRALGEQSHPFDISTSVYEDNMDVFMEFFDAMEQQDSAFHADLHGHLDPPFTLMADGSFIALADQAALPLIRLGSAYKRNPDLFNQTEHIRGLANYLIGLQGVQVEERTDGTGFRLNEGMQISNAFVPGPTELESIDVYSAGSSPSLIATVPVVSLCGSDDASSAWDACIEHAATYYKCQIDEPCLNLTYVENTGVVNGTDGYGISRGWGYEFGCFPDIPLEEGAFNDTQNPCMIFYPQDSRDYTTMALLGFLEAVPAIYDESPEEAQELYTRAVNTHAFISENYAPFKIGDADAGYWGAALFLLYDYSGNESYLEDAYYNRYRVSTSFSSEGTKGNEFYWEEYVRHKDELKDAGFGFWYQNTSPEQFFRGKIFGDYKDRGQYSISNNGERVYEYDHNIQFQNSRYILTEGLLAAKATDLVPSAEQFISDVAHNQVAWLTGMNGVQDGVGLGSNITAYSFIFGIGEHFPTEFHSRYLLDTGYRNSSGGQVIGARGTDLQWHNGSKYVYFDGATRILGQELGALGNGYRGEDKIMPYDKSKTFANGKAYIPGWINGAFDINTAQETDTIFNYADTLSTYEFTETTGEIVASAVELFAYLDAQSNGKMPHGPIMFNATITIPVNNETNGTNQTGGNETDGNETGSNDTSQCHASVEHLPATCSGIIIGDTFDGGRHITCSDGDNTLSVSAWDKPAITNATHFEMYKNVQEGSGITICLAGTCLSNEGFVRGDDYPFCEGNVSAVCGDGIVDTGEQCDDGNSANGDGCNEACVIETAICGNSIVEPGEQCDDGNGIEGDGCNNSCQQGDVNVTASVTLSVKQWYPQGTHYVFVCAESGYEAESYSWVFGDGHEQTTESDNVYHIYASNETYDVACTASDASTSQSDTLQITVG